MQVAGVLGFAGLSLVLMSVPARAEEAQPEQLDRCAQWRVRRACKDARRSYEGHLRQRQFHPDGRRQRP